MRQAIATNPDIIQEKLLKREKQKENELLEGGIGDIFEF